MPPSHFNSCKSHALALHKVTKPNIPGLVPDICPPYNAVASMSSRRVSMNNSRLHPFRLIFLSLLALLLVAPSHLTMLTWDDHGLIKASTYPSEWTIPAADPDDLDNDGQPEMIMLQAGKAEIHSDSQPVWSSPTEWEVVQAEITDLNNDGSPEVTLLVWRPFSPWPIDAYIPHPGRIQDFHDREYRSCHLILIGWSRGAYRELWAGSALADPLSAFTAVDINQDGLQELAAMESQYNAPFFATRSITVWEWNGFGFTLLTRGPNGYFHSLNTIRTSAGQELLLAQGILRR
jgi:hypothetical protein